MDKKRGIIIKFEDQKLYFLKEGSVYYYHCGNSDSVSSKPSVSAIATLCIIGTIIIRQLRNLNIFLNNLIARFVLIIVFIIVLYFLVNVYIHKNMRYPEVSNEDIYWKSGDYLEVLQSTYKGNNIIDIMMIFTGIFCIIFSTAFLFTGNLVALALNLVVSCTFILLVKSIRIKYEVSGTDLVFDYRITRKSLKKLKKEGMF